LILSARLDSLGRRHPTLFLIALVLLTIAVVAVLRMAGLSGAAVMYQAF
jgi:hypothetical protein